MLEMFIAGVAAVLASAWIGNRVVKSRMHAQAARLIAAGPQDFVDGAVLTAVGTVRARRTLTAPISQRPCLAYHLKAWMGPAWFTRTDMVEFVLETPHGDILVEPWPDAGFALPIAHLRPTYSVAKAYLVAQGRTIREASNATFEEMVVEVGTKIAVYGVVHTELAPPSTSRELGFRDDERIIRLRGTPAHPLSIGLAK